MTEHRRLLAEYAASGSEQAFQILVERYVDLCYSTALRLVNGDAHLAEDISQMVFADLARLAGTVPEEILLGGWLHRRTCHVAATMMRKERRRQHRERCAAEMNAMDSHEDTHFEQIAPLLDEAINGLSSRDQTAIVLRFFEKRDLRTIGDALGSNEDAAQKRIGRALDKLRSHFARRGIVVSSAVMASIIMANAVQAAPSGLASGIAAASLATGTAAGSSVLFPFLKTILMKKILCSIAVVAIIAGVLVPFLIARAKHAHAPANAAASAPVTAASLAKGRILHLTFDQDETGTKVTDASGQSNHGKAAGVRWVAEGKKGGAYEFTADGNEIVVPNNESLNPEQMTLAAWVKTTSADAFWRRIFDKSYTQQFALGLAGDWEANKWHGQVSLEVGPGNHFSITKTKVNDGQWHQVVATYDGVEQLLYVDGKLDSRPVRWRPQEQMGTTDFNLVIGCNRSNVGGADFGISFRGLIDEPMMWHRALSPPEVASLFESQR